MSARGRTGAAAAAHAAGHIPGAAYLDWRADLVEPGRREPVVPAGRPRPRARPPSGRLGVSGGSTVVLYDDTASLYAARAWWSLRVYGLESCRILDGGFPAWTRALATELSTARRCRRRRPRSPRGPCPGCASRPPTCAACSGRRTSILLDARAPAEYRGFEGNTRRLGHIPGRGQRPGVDHDRAGQRLFRPADALRDFLLEGERHPRPADGVLRRIGDRGGQARVRADPARATRTWRSTTAAGRNGATGWTCRSIAREPSHRRATSRSVSWSRVRRGGAARVTLGHRDRPTDRPPGAAPGSGRGSD